MKIGILTASRTDNHGTDLQALAMQWLFCQVSDDVELINYSCPKLESRCNLFRIRSWKQLLLFPVRIRNHRNHVALRKRYFRHSSRLYSPGTLSDNPYDLVVVGSDQIWNLAITDNDTSFFLPYSNPRQRKFSYAASLGRTDLSQWEAAFCLSRLLNDFQSISVRESSGVDALASIGIQARHDLDPLLMIPAERWCSLIKPVHIIKPYIFVYAASDPQGLTAFARSFAKEHNLQVVLCEGNSLRPEPGVRVFRSASPEQWLSLLSQASVIVTNSYHCLSFAVNFHKPFALFHLRKNTQSNTRLNHLLQISGLERQEDGVVYHPDWDAVDSHLNAARERSLVYIRRMVKC